MIDAGSLRDELAAAKAVLREADSDDHFYGAWKGGKASEGGGPATSQDTVHEALIKKYPAWAVTHANSMAITGESATIMGIPGYTKNTGPLDRVERDLHGDEAPGLLGAIAKDRMGAPETLYHGYNDSAGRAPGYSTPFKPGDTVDLPLLATTGAPHYAARYGVPDPAYQYAGTTLFEFPRGTPMAGYAHDTHGLIQPDGQASIWMEAIVAGRFRVTGVREAVVDLGFPGSHDRTIRYVSLRQTHTYDPDTKGWVPTRTERG